MILPGTFKDWKDTEKLFQIAPASLRMSAEETIRLSTDWLISRLYYPDEEVGARLSEFWLDTLGLHDIGKEAINWGDLGCVEVKEYAEGGWEVFIEEAAPECPALQAYIAKWLTAWGWTPVEVRTEW